VLYLVVEQGVVMYASRRSPQGNHQHDPSKDTISLPKRIMREIFRSQLFGLETLKFTK
jgi:hypothetical protein